MRKPSSPALSLPELKYRTPLHVKLAQDILRRFAHYTVHLRARRLVLSRQELKRPGKRVMKLVERVFLSVSPRRQNEAYGILEDSILAVCQEHNADPKTIAKARSIVLGDATESDCRVA